MFAETYFFIIKSLQRTWPWPDSAKNIGNLPKISYGFLKTRLKQGKRPFLPYFGLFSENRGVNIFLELYHGFLKTGQNGVKRAFSPVLGGGSENRGEKLFLKHGTAFVHIHCLLFLPFWPKSMFWKHTFRAFWLKCMFSKHTFCALLIEKYVFKRTSVLSFGP